MVWYTLSDERATALYFVALIASVAACAACAVIDYRRARAADARFALRCLTATVIVLVLSLGQLLTRRSP